MASIQDREATVKTAIVEIKCLTVSGRQVTQSLFKQIPESDLIDEDSLTFRGVPWGRVNYHVGCSEYTGRHLHIVWQWGDELRRSCVAWNQGENLAKRQAGFPESWFWTAVLKSAFEDEPLLDEERVSQLSKEQRRAGGTLRTGGMVCRDIPAELGVELYRWWNGGVLEEWYSSESGYTAEYLEKLRKGNCERAASDIIKIFKRFGAREDWQEHSVTAALKQYHALREKGQRIRGDWAKLWQALSDLDQLFIAV